MNYLITGIAGFVGSSLARALLEFDSGAQITGIDDLSFGYEERILDIRPRIEFINGDVKNLNSILQGKKFDSIIHCAAIAPLPECQRDSYRALAQNVAICGSIVDYATLSGSRDIVFFSSGAIYEGVKTLPTPESVSISPILVYPITKFLAEQYFQAMCQAYDINVSAIRLFNLYGPHQDYFRKQPPLIGYLLSCLLQNRTAEIYATGDQTRDYIFIDDLTACVTSTIEKMKLLQGGGNFMALNAGSGSSTSVDDIIAIIEDIAGESIKIERRLPGGFWDKYPDLFDRQIPLDTALVEREVRKTTLADTRTANAELSWSATTSLRDGLQSCFEFAKTIL